MSAKKNTAVAEAQEGLKPIIDMLIALGARCMEQVIDRAGVVIERWLLPNGRIIIAFGAPHWRDAFESVAPIDGTWAATFAALDLAAKCER